MTSSDEELKELLKQATTYKQDPRHRIPMVDRPSKILTQSNKCRENKARKCSNCTCNKNTNTNNTIYKSKWEAAILEILLDVHYVRIKDYHHLMRVMKSILMNYK